MVFNYFNYRVPCLFVTNLKEVGVLVRSSQGLAVAEFGELTGALVSNGICECQVQRISGM